MTRDRRETPSPVDVDADAAGNIYFSDSGNDLVQLFIYPHGEE